MNKKILSLLLSILLAAALFQTVSASSPEIYLDAPSSVKEGESFTVTLGFSGNPGFCGIELTLNYDFDKYECTSVKVSTLLSEALSATNVKATSGAKIAAASSQAIYGDGELASFTFTAKKSVNDLSMKLSNVYVEAAEGSDKFLSVSLPDGSTSNTVTGSGAGSSGSTSAGGNSGSTGTGSSGSSGGSGGSGTGTNGSKPESAAAEKTAFTDTAGHWGEEFIVKAASLGLFNGYTDGTFRPDQNVTRGQFVTVLYRMAGSPETEINTPFTDISSQSAEFQKAIAWAYKNEYVNGVSETAFDPNGTLTREAAMKILFFYAGGVSGMESMLESVYDGTYTDSGAVSSWAKQPMYWGIYNRIISGTSASTLSPKGTATRAQLAKILVNYIDTIA